MTTLYITEFASLAQDTTAGGGVLLAKWPYVAKQTLSNTGGSTPSNPFNAATRFIRVHTDAICSIVIGNAGQTAGVAVAPTATTSDARMAANSTEYFAVSPGDKLSVIANT